MTTSEIVFLLLLAFVNSFVIIGWNKASHYDIEDGKIVEDSKMIFWKLRYWSLKYLGVFWSKPLFTCATCMASVHSLYFYWITMPFTVHSLICYPFYVLGLAGLATLVNNYS